MLEHVAAGRPDRQGIGLPEVCEPLIGKWLISERKLSWQGHRRDEVPEVSAWIEPSLDMKVSRSVPRLGSAQACLPDSIAWDEEQDRSMSHCELLPAWVTQLQERRLTTSDEPPGAA
jgi:hypothetical protein